MLEALALPVLTVVVIWLYWRWRNRRLLELAGMVPGPPTVPILGNTLLFLSKSSDVLDIMTKLMMRYGEYMKFWIGPELNIVVRNPDDIRFLLTSNKINEKGPLYNALDVIIGKGILTGGPTWRAHRKLATPSYNKKSVQHYTNVFNDEIDAYAEQLTKKDPDKIFDVYFDVVTCTTQVVCQTLMGLSKEDAQSIYRLKEVVEETETMYNFFFDKITRWWYRLPFVSTLTGRTAQEKFYRKLISDVTNSIIDKRHHALNSTQDMTSSGIPDGIGVVDRFILSKELSDREIFFETFTLFTTSQEAAAKIASSVLVFLAYLPEWQDLVYKEIVELLGAEDRFLTNEDVKKLRYLDMVFNEALRYFAIAAFIQRRVEEEITIKNGTLTLPVGASVTLPLHILHRDPNYWTDPYKVDPGRFLPENVKNRKANAFVPFSLGAMDCIGRVYAKCLIKMLVVKTLRRVQLLPGDLDLDNLTLHVAVSVRLMPGYNIRCRSRK